MVINISSPLFLTIHLLFKKPSKYVNRAMCMPWNEEDVDDLLPQRVSNCYTQLPLYQTYHVFQANWGKCFIFTHRRLFR
jgi:hypothetical protein